MTNSSVRYRVVVTWDPHNSRGPRGRWRVESPVGEFGEKTIVEIKALVTLPSGSSDRKYVNNWGKYQGAAAADAHADRMRKEQQDVPPREEVHIEYEYEWIDESGTVHQNNDGSG